MKRTYIKEIAEFEGSDPEAVNLEVAVAKLKDEVIVYLASFYKGNNKNLAMVVAKLDEAWGYAVQHGMQTGRLAVVNRAELIKAANEYAEV